LQTRLMKPRNGRISRKLLKARSSNCYWVLA
jgi:hypothetical protein